MLNRVLISNQGNKDEPGARWFRFKEAFSADFVRWVLATYPMDGAILDPFAGAGTALFVAREQGRSSFGIDPSPVSAALINARSLPPTAEDIAALRSYCTEPLPQGEYLPLPDVPIANGAYPQETLYKLCCFRGAMLENPLHTWLEVAMLACLEDISYTKKDGQFLRWDSQAPREGLCGSKHFKDPVPIEIFHAKLAQIVEDLAVLPTAPQVSFQQASCLDVLPCLPSEEFAGVITSPPYANRYDYTRTYALELAYLGLSDSEIKRLRQTMLSATVENRQKDITAYPDITRFTARIIAPVLKTVSATVLNNRRVTAMLQWYCEEMACVIQELHRIITPGGYCVMVNDPVAYAGVVVPIHTILTEIAQQVGFSTEILTVADKGQSSQQMEIHGRTPLPKCVLVWKKGGRHV